MRKAFFQLHVAVFLAGFTGVMGRLIHLNEAVLVWYRLLISCVVLWAGRWVARRATPGSARQHRQAAAIGIILILHWVVFYAGIKQSNISTAVVCFSAVGFFTALLEPILLRRRADPGEILLGAIVIAGISIVFRFDRQYQTGIILSLFSAFLASLFSILNNRYLGTLDAGTATRYQLSGGFVFLTALLPVYLHYVPPTDLLPSPGDWLWLFVLAVVCTVLAYSLYMMVMQVIPPFTINLTYSLEPIYSIALAFLFFRENKEVSGGFYPGLGLIVLAIVLQMIRLRRRQSVLQAARVEI